MTSDEQNMPKKLRRSYVIKKIGNSRTSIATASREDSLNYENNRRSSHYTTSKTRSTGPILKNFRNFCPLPPTFPSTVLGTTFKRHEMFTKSAG